MYIPKKIVLVTGHNGFIGKKLCETLLFKGFFVVGVGRGSSVLHSSNFVSHELDLNDKRNVSSIFQHYMPEIIVDLAGGSIKSLALENICEYIQINTQASLNVINSALELTNLKKFIFLGSCEEYGEISTPFIESSQELPGTPYGLVKLFITRYLQSLSRLHDFPSLILRPSVIYGPDQSEKMFIPDLVMHLLNQKKFDMSKGDQTRDFIFSHDVVRAILLAIELKNYNGEIFNISSNNPILIKDLSLVVANYINSDAYKLINYGVKNYRKGEAINYFADNSKSKRLLNWVPETSLEDGILRTIEQKKRILFK